METLNPRFYSRIKSSFGNIRIANLGRPVEIFTSDDDPFDDHPSEIRHWGETYHVNCPFCHLYSKSGRPDTKQRLYICHKWGEYIGTSRAWYLIKCHNEDCFHRDRANKSKLIKEIFSLAKPPKISGVLNPELYGRLKLIFRNVKISNPGKHIEISASIDPNPPEVSFTSTESPSTPTQVSLPLSIPVTDLPDDHPAQQFLLARGVDRAKQVCYDIRYSNTRDPTYPSVHESIIFPIYMNKQLVSWQARSLNPYKNKYFICPGTKKSNILYGWDLVLDSDYCVLVEGVFDVIRLWPHIPALGLLGHSVSPTQAKLLTRFKTVLFYPDSDVSDEEVDRYVDLLRKYNINAFGIRNFLTEDPADMSENLIYKAKRVVERIFKNGSEKLLTVEDVRKFVD